MESSPCERLLKPESRPDWRWVGRGKMTLFLLPPEKWQINLEGAAWVAISSVIIKLKMIIYI